jgi:hypothetical protein
MYCDCGELIEGVRLELNLQTCRSCAFSGPDIERPKGRMVYSNKVGAEIEILSAETWNANKRYFTPSGARSAVKNFSKSICV